MSMDAIKICVSNYTSRVPGGGKVCLLGQSRVGERRPFSEEFELNPPAQHLSAQEAKRAHQQIGTIGF